MVGSTIAMVSLMTTAVLCCFLTLSRPDFLFSDALAGVIASAVAVNTTIDENRIEVLRMELLLILPFEVLEI
jgi:hypothetical protein